MVKFKCDSTREVVDSRHPAKNGFFFEEKSNIKGATRWSRTKCEFAYAELPDKICICMSYYFFSHKKVNGPKASNEKQREVRLT